MMIYGRRFQIKDYLHNATGSLPPVEGEREKAKEEGLLRALSFFSGHDAPLICTHVLV